MYWTQIVNTDGLFSWCIFRADCHDNSMKEKWEKGIKGLLISPRLLNQIWDLNSGLWVDRSSLLDITWPSKFCVSIPHFIVLCRYCILKKLTFVNPVSSKFIWHHFSISICLLHVSVSHFGNCCSISNLFLLLYLWWWFVIGDLLCYCYNCFRVLWTTFI